LSLFFTAPTQAVVSLRRLNFTRSPMRANSSQMRVNYGLFHMSQPLDLPLLHRIMRSRNTTRFFCLRKQRPPRRRWRDLCQVRSHRQYHHFENPTLSFLAIPLFLFPSSMDISSARNALGSSLDWDRQAIICKHTSMPILVQLWVARGAITLRRILSVTQKPTIRNLCAMHVL